MANNVLADIYWKYESGIQSIFWYGLAVLIVLGLGLVNLFYPFDMDQAVAMMGAESLGRSGTLYVDYWDNKQPGLYYFYHLGGTLFGYSEAGVHLLELVWMMSFAVVMMVTLRPLLGKPWLSALAPVATIGVYYATADNQLTQLEMLIGFPIYVSVWCAFRATQRPDHCLPFCLTGGVATGIVVLFKLVYAPLLVVPWLVATIYIASQGRNWFWAALRLGIPVAIGVLIPLCAALWYFWQQDALDELLWTTFVYPTEAFASAPPASKTRWLTAAAFFTLYFAPWALFAAIAGYRWIANPSNAMVGMLLAWILLGILLFYIQSFSWWPYHAFIFFVPAGILAVFGLDAVLGYISNLPDKPRHLDSLASIILVIPLCASLTAPFLKKAQLLLSELWMQRNSVEEYQWTIDNKYRYLFESVQFLFEEDALPGPIYSLGHARIYSLAKRDPPHAIAGSFWEFYLPEQREDILRTLLETRVPYIFVDEVNDEIRFTHPELVNFLNEYYYILKRDYAGTWYQRKSEQDMAEDPGS